MSYRFFIICCCLVSLVYPRQLACSSPLSAFSLSEQVEPIRPKPEQTKKKTKKKQRLASDKKRNKLYQNLHILAILIFLSAMLLAYYALRWKNLLLLILSALCLVYYYVWWIWVYRDLQKDPDEGEDFDQKYKGFGCFVGLLFILSPLGYVLLFYWSAATQVWLLVILLSSVFFVAVILILIFTLIKIAREDRALLEEEGEADKITKPKKKRKGGNTRRYDYDR